MNASEDRTSQNSLFIVAEMSASDAAAVGAASGIPDADRHKVCLTIEDGANLRGGLLADPMMVAVVSAVVNGVVTTTTAVWLAKVFGGASKGDVVVRPSQGQPIALPAGDPTVQERIEETTLVKDDPVLLRWVENMTNLAPRGALGAPGALRSDIAGFTAPAGPIDRVGFWGDVGRRMKHDPALREQIRESIRRHGLGAFGVEQQLAPFDSETPRTPVRSAQNTATG